jgi:hypothetical protein
MPITASSAQLAALPIQQGTNNLALVSGSQPANVTGASPFGSLIPITSQLVAFTLASTGTLDNASVIELQAEINGSSFSPVYVNGTKVSFTGTQINAGGSAGVYSVAQVKANRIRFAMSTVGTTSGANGVITRVMD